MDHTSASSQPPNQESLIIFIRYPALGKVKTRLIPAIGVEAATSLYQQLAEQTVAQARALQRLRSTAITGWFTGGSVAAMQAWLGPDLTYQPQPEGDLGDRLWFAFQTAFHQGYQAVIAIGTDCPQLDTAILHQGFQALHHHDLVVGPANDGGYYLLGLQRRGGQPALSKLFQGIAWSTSTVLQTTLERADGLGLRCTDLPQLIDIDTLEDLETWQRMNPPQ